MNAVLRHLGTIASAAALAATLAFACPAEGATPTTAAVADRHADYQAELAQVRALGAQYQRLAANAAITSRRAEDLRAAVGDDDGGLVDAVAGFFSSEPSALDAAAEAAQDAADARELADLVHEELVEQIAASDEARRAWQRAERQRMRAEAALTASEYADRAIGFARFLPGYTASDREQDRLNREALAVWHDQLRRVGEAAVVPPTVGALIDPRHLPDGLVPARGSGFDVVPGVASADLRDGESVTVLSSEAVRAVSEAFRRVGQSPTSDATSYACGGLVAETWAGPDLGAPPDAVTQWESLASVPRSSVQVGDVVLLGTKQAGLTGTGVYVGAGNAVVADATTGVAAVRPVTNLLAARRLGLEVHQPRTAPEGGLCGAQPAPSTDGPLLLPVPAGSYTLTSRFGDAGSHWSSGAHTGLDFAAPVGTPVVAAAGGTVTVEHPGWAGSLVRIDHGNGLETWYAHLSRTDVATGDVVEAGTPVGLVGEEGNTTGPHLHFEVRLDGAPYDPAPLLGLADALR